MSRSRRLGIPGRIIICVVLAVYMVPLYWMLSTAFNGAGTLEVTFSSIVFTPTLSNVIAALPIALPGLRVSLELALAVTAITIVLASAGAFAITSRRGGRIVGVVALLTVPALVLMNVVPPTTSVLPLYTILANWHLINSLSGVIVADAATHLPFAILLLRPFFMTVPSELHDAARVDGARVFTIFFRIVLPMVTNGIITVSMLVFILTWGAFLYPIIFLNDPSTFPISAILASQVGPDQTNWGALMALALLATLPVAIVFAVGQRWIKRGVAIGAIR